MAWSWVRVRVQELGELCSEPQRATAGTAGTQRPAWVEGMTLSAACKSLQNFFQPRTFTALSLGTFSELARYSRSPTDTDVGSRTVPLHFTKSSLERLLRFDLPLPATSGHRPRTYIPPNIMPRGTSTKPKSRRDEKIIARSSVVTPQRRSLPRPAVRQVAPSLR